MGNFNKRHVLSLLIAAGGCVAGAYSAYAAFSNGRVISDGTAGTMFGLAFGSVVLISWIMLPWADKRAEEGSYRDAWLWRGSWLLALGFVLANSIAYCAHYRTEMTEVKGLQIETYQRAQSIESLATAQLERLRTNSRWIKTSGCSNIPEKSRRYCELVRETETRLRSAQETLAQGRPASKDAGAEILAWVLGGDEAKIRRSLPIFWAVILELIASLCMREAFATLRVTHAAAREVEEEFSVPSGLTLTPVTARMGQGGELAQAALFGNLTLFNRTNPTPAEREPMNDNMPFAAYA